MMKPGSSSLWRSAVNCLLLVLLLQAGGALGLSSSSSSTAPHVVATSAQSSSTSSSITATPATTTISAEESLLLGVASGDTNNNSNNDLAWNSLVGEADRAFCWGAQLEKNGQARKALAAYHEAATLYQCHLDSPEGEFGHVTCLSKNKKDNGGVSTMLAQASLRLGQLNRDAVGDPQAAVRLYQQATRLQPLAAESWDGLGQSLEAAAAAGSSSASSSLQDAVTAYRRALELEPDNMKVVFHLAVALERLEQTAEAEALLDRLRRQEAVYACLVDSWGYIRWHTRKNNPDTNLYRGTYSMLELALQATLPTAAAAGGSGGTGWICEFGVGSGRSLRMTQEIVPLDTDLHGFDTFTGLPSADGSSPAAGTYSTGGAVPNMEGRSVYFYKGLFRDTLGPFLERAGPDDFLAYANIDCDLYTSTMDVLEAMHGRIVPGTILVFGEYTGHASWRQDEFRAWRECCKRYGWKYEYLAFSLSTNQAVVRVLEA